MFKRIFSFVLLAIAAVAAFAQVDFSVSYKRVSPTEIDVVFTGKAAPGWHVYGTNIPDGGPTPASFNIDSAKGARLKGALKGGPGIKSSMDPIFEMEVSYYEGTAVFTQRVELVKYTVCTASAASCPMRTTDTEPLGSSSLAPVLGSPSSAVSIVSLSAKVTMSGCTPTAAVETSSSEPSSLHANSATTPASA